MDFAYLRYWYASYYNKAKAVGWENLETEMWTVHVAYLWMIWSNTKKVHKVLKDEIIVQANHDTGACYRVSKCAEIVFEHRKIVRGKGIPAPDERMETIDPDEKEIYKFLRVEEADGIKTKVVFGRVKSKVD